MTDYKILGQEAPSADTESDLYTVPADKSTVVRAINVTNTASASDTFDIAITPSASATTNADYIFRSHEILGNETITIKGGYTLDSNNKLKIKSTNGTSTFNAFGGEI
jgi:hypothetical protein